MQTYETPSIDLESREYQENGTYAWIKFGFYYPLKQECDQAALMVGRPQLEHFSFTPLVPIPWTWLWLGNGTCAIPSW